MLEKLQIEIRPLPKKRKAPAACAGTPLCICIWLSSYSLPVCVWLHNATSSYTPTLTRLILHAYSTTPPPLTVSTASPAPQTRAEQLAEMEELRAQNQRLMALVAAANAAGNAQTAPRGEALHDWVMHGPPQPRGAHTCSVSLQHSP